MNTKIIKFDINKNLYNTLIAKQGDTKSRFLLFNLLDGSIPFSLENRSVRVYAVKPDRTEVFNDLIITDAAKGYCILELTTQMLAVAGTVKLELMVIEEDKKLTSSIFYMDVKASINSEKAVVSTNEFGALLTALSSLNEYDNYKKEIAAARDGEANLLTKVKKIDEQLEHKANEVDLKTLESRMNTFTKLPEGSTTGDAELTDGRVGINGYEYDNIGGAIRGQISKIIEIENSTNLFDSSKIKANTAIGYNVDKSIKYTTVDGFTSYLLRVIPGKTYTITALSFSCYGFDKDLKQIANIKTIETSETNVTVTIPENCRYISVCFRHESYPVNKFMIVEGTSLPSTYTPYFEHVKLKDNVIINYPEAVEEKIYTVGTGKNFTTLTQAIRTLKNDSAKKTLLIDSGEYDMYEEMGGQTYFTSLDDSKSWQELNDIVPPNTKIICPNGMAIFKFQPSSTQITNALAGLISPFNFIYDAHMENVMVIADNCRYAIHDESGKYESGIGKKHYYKNVILEKKITNFGNTCGFGCGFIGNNNFEFDSCIFKCVDRPLSMHNSSDLGVNDNTNILIKNSCFITYGNTSNRAINLRNTNPHQAHITVSVINSVLDAPLVIQNETETERPNAFDVTVIAGAVPSISVKNTTNIYTPKKY